jgi:hypothetical protein
MLFACSPGRMSDGSINSRCTIAAIRKTQKTSRRRSGSKHLRRLELFETNRVSTPGCAPSLSISNAPILPKEGTWNIWVLHDPTYVAFGSAQTAESEPNKLEKWDAAIKVAQAKARRIGKTEDPRTFDNNTETAAGPRRFRVMVGGADRIENLWPKQ